MAVDSSKIKAFVGKESAPIRVLDPISKSDIRHWCELVGDPDPSYEEKIKKGEKTAPPLMTMAWAMPALWPPKEPTEPHEKLDQLLSDAGYPLTVGIKLEQEFSRPIRIGDRLTYKVKVGNVSEGEAKLGRGYLVDCVYTFQNQAGEDLATIKYTLLKFARILPRTSAAAA